MKTKIQLKQDINLVKENDVIKSLIFISKKPVDIQVVFIHIYIYGKCVYDNLPFECTKIYQQRENK